MWKFNIPSSERPKVLRFLEEFNLNAYSLYGSEDSLMQTLTTRELDLSESYSVAPASKKPKKPVLRSKVPVGTG